MEERNKARGKDDNVKTAGGALVVARPPLEPEKTALVIVDMQNLMVTRGVGFMKRVEESGMDIEYRLDRINNIVVPNLQRLIPICRQNGAKIIYTRSGCHRKDCSDAIPQFRALFKDVNAIDGTWDNQVIDALKPEEGDINILKTGSSAFYSSNLDSILRNMGVEHVIYTGGATNGCLLLTAAGGFDRGYNGFVVGDATFTTDEKLQRRTETIISFAVAQVVSTDEIIKMITKKR